MWPRRRRAEIGLRCPPVCSGYDDEVVPFVIALMGLDPVGCGALTRSVWWWLDWVCGIDLPAFALVFALVWASTCSPVRWCWCPFDPGTWTGITSRMSVGGSGGIGGPCIGRLERAIHSGSAIRRGTILE
jgi:hypothetical protein